MDKQGNSKKKGNKLMRNLFKWKGGKSRSADSTKQQSNRREHRGLTPKDIDEESWQRIKNMEQTRQISAMKSHIDKLQSKLDSMDNHNNNKASSPTASPATNTKNSNTKRSTAHKNLQQQINAKPKAANHGFSESCKASKDESQESGEEIQVYIEEEESNSKDGSSRDFNPPAEKDEIESRCDEKKCSSNDSRSSGFSEPTMISTAMMSTAEVQVHESSLVHEDNADKIQCPGSSDYDGQSSKMENLAHTVKENENTPSLESGNETESQPSPDYLTHPNKDMSEVSSNESTDSIIPDDPEELTSLNYLQGGDNRSDGDREDGVLNFMHDDIDVDNNEGIQEEIRPFVGGKNDLAMLNSELRGRVAELEEQVWLAAEDKRNMQAMLELQKERALKNLAFKFEDINRKTLREFKGIFEYRLQVLNEEKLKLQEKIENHRCPAEDNAAGCQACEQLRDELLESKAKSAKLAEDNTFLKRHCRKLSGDLGKVKKTLNCSNTTEENSVTETGTQTEPPTVWNHETGTPSQGSLETSINDLHDDVKVIAATVSTLSDQIIFNKNRWTSENNEHCSNNGLLQSLSVYNEDSGNESIRLSPTKSRSDQDESEIDDEINSCSESVGNRLNSIPTTRGSIDSSKLGDDVDSGIFTSDISEYEIGKHLDRIHRKYLKISEELEDYASSKLRSKLETSSKVSCLPFNMNELDPEIVKIVEDVNRKYDEYFKSKIVL